MRISGIDANLIVALNALLQERSVTRAADRMGLGQPAMSHALARLRDQLGDPLLIRRRNSLVLTERAVSLIEPTALAVAQLERVFEPQGAFDPHTAQRRFRLFATDNLELYVLPLLCKRISAEAPGVSLHVRHLPAEWPDELATGGADLKLGRGYDPPSGMHRQDLLQERFACVLRRGHRAARQTLTLERYAALAHILVSPAGGERGLVDELLATRGLRRQIALTIQHFVVAPFIVARTNLALTIPQRLASMLQRSLRLVVMPMPLALQGYTLAQMWHDRTHADPAHVWLRRTIAEVCESL